jgi:Mrp family chromosome partitioning ATPase
MAATFDNAVEKLIEACLSHADWADVARVAVVRDLRGRLRLVLKPEEGKAVPLIGPVVASALGPWFAGPVLSTASGRSDEQRLAREILGRANTWPPEWPSGWTDLAGTSHPIDLARWTGFQRVHSKQSWFGPPNFTSRKPLVDGEPAIVAFYSFKGGVGRTTTLALVASALARSGKRVICVDLDLEAPGLGDFLGASASPSLLDALLGHAATDTLPKDELVQWISVHGAHIGVVSAGALDRSYLEKLARLDYLGATSEEDSPVARALQAVLQRLRGHRPDIVLLDCRAGLHDLGGLSLTSMSSSPATPPRTTTACGSPWRSWRAGARPRSAA